MKHLGEKILSLFIGSIVCGLAGCSFYGNSTPDQLTALIVTPTFHPQVQYSLLVNDLLTEQHSVKKNQQFADLLHDYRVSSVAWQQLNTLKKNQFDFRKVTTGRPYSLFIKPDSACSLQALVYEMNPIEYVIFHFNDSLRLEYCQKEVVLANKTVTGVIEKNLSETISRQGISHELTNRMVDILGWQIDFYRLQKGDSFKIVFQEKSVDGVPIGIGEILGIHFSNSGKTLLAVPFDQGEGQDYFDEEGNSIRKAFLKYPIEFTHISSRYSLNRFHPVLKVNRPHLGTDLSAATGTPIRSVGDGVVMEAGYNGGSGNYVKVRHNGTYITGYLHMSRIGSGIRAGVTIKQGQVIGFVGSTGWATGPHLCYRFWKNGIQVDALKVQIPPAKPIRKEMLGNYLCALEEAMNRLQFVKNPIQAALAVR